MSCISEDGWSAGWLIGLEDILWDAIHEEPQENNSTDCTPSRSPRHWSVYMDLEQRDNLLRLIEEIGGWIYWEEAKGMVGETYITLENWVHKKRK